jgi:hypothetical protein
MYLGVADNASSAVYGLARAGPYGVQAPSAQTHVMHNSESASIGSETGANAAASPTMWAVSTMVVATARARRASRTTMITMPRCDAIGVPPADAAFIIAANSLVWLRGLACA